MLAVFLASIAKNGYPFHRLINLSCDLKINQEIQSGLKVTDMFGTTDISQIMQLKQQGQLLQYEPLGKENLLEAYRNLDPENFYQTKVMKSLLAFVPTRL